MNAPTSFEKIAPSVRPSRAGWYVVALRLSPRPLVLWWSMLQTRWRWGATLIDDQVEWYMGPIS